MFKTRILDHVRLSTVLTGLAVFGNLMLCGRKALGYQMSARTPLEVDTFIMVCVLVSFVAPFFALLSLIQFRKRQYMYELVISSALLVTWLLYFC